MSCTRGERRVGLQPQAGAQTRVHRAQEQTFGVDAAELERVLEAEPLIVGVVLIHTYGVPARDTWKTLELAQKFNVW
jgi:hypothetical protein